MGSSGPESPLRVLEPPGPRFASIPVVSGGTGKEIIANLTGWGRLDNLMALTKGMLAFYRISA